MCFFGGRIRKNYIWQAVFLWKSTNYSRQFVFSGGWHGEPEQMRTNYELRSTNYEQMLAKWILLPSSNRHLQNGACANVTKITWLNIDSCWPVNAGALISGSWIEILEFTPFWQELTKLLISVDELPQYLLFYFQKNAFIIKLRLKFIIEMIRESLHSAFNLNPPK